MTDLPINEWVVELSLKRAAGVCPKCGKRVRGPFNKLVVQRVVFERPGDEKMDDVRVVCRACLKNEHKRRKALLRVWGITGGPMKRQRVKEDYQKRRYLKNPPKSLSHLEWVERNHRAWRKLREQGLLIEQGWRKDEA